MNEGVDDDEDYWGLQQFDTDAEQEEACNVYTWTSERFFLRA